MATVILVARPVAEEILKGSCYKEGGPEEEIPGVLLISSCSSEPTSGSFPNLSIPQGALEPVLTSAWHTVGPQQIPTARMDSQPVLSCDISPFGLSSLMYQKISVSDLAPHLVCNTQQGREWGFNTHRKVGQQVPLLLPEPTGGSVSCFPRSTGVWRNHCRHECPWSRSSVFQSSRCQPPIMQSPVLFWSFLYLALISWDKGFT